MAYEACVEFWHSAQGHSHPQSFFNQNPYSDGEILPRTPSESFCNPYTLSNSTLTPYKLSNPKATEVKNLNHADLVQLSSTLYIGKSAYDIVYIDNQSRYPEIFLIKKKSDTLNRWKTYYSCIYTWTRIYPWSIKTQDETEYVNAEFTTFCEENSIQYITTALYRQFSNTIAEHYNRML